MVPHTLLVTSTASVTFLIVILTSRLTTVATTQDDSCEIPAASLDPKCISKMSVIRKITPMQPGPMDVPDPFIFCVYHKDKYPAGNDKCEAPRVGNGMDFDPNAEYRMYHGSTVPGFPQHPHRGFETITATLEGLIDHTDSMGNAGRYGDGDLQWMTAGKGVVHGEMFPLLNDNKPNPAKFFQIWLNLPAKNKMCEPAFTMHWANNVTRKTSDDGLAEVIVWAGSVGDAVAAAPPSDSYASDRNNGVGVIHLTIKPTGEVKIPKTSVENRWAYFVEGSTVEINSNKASVRTILELDSKVDLTFKNNHVSETVEILLLEGQPIGEPVAQHGPFVMNTQQEIQQAFADYRATAFGGWPWPDDAMVFPRTKGRFALQNGKETQPTV